MCGANDLQRGRQIPARSLPATQKKYRERIICHGEGGCAKTSSCTMLAGTAAAADPPIGVTIIDTDDQQGIANFWEREQFGLPDDGIEAVSVTSQDYKEAKEVALEADSRNRLSLSTWRGS